MDEALSELSLRCNPKDAGRALYLLSAPAKEMNMDLIKELGDYLRDIAPEATIRNGDYPRERGVMDVAVILSELNTVDKVTDYYCKSAGFLSTIKERQEEVKGKLREIEDASKDIPSLL
jgi:cell division GTPase FtsZ